MANNQEVTNNNSRVSTWVINNHSKLDQNSIVTEQIDMLLNEKTEQSVNSPDAKACCQSPRQLI